MSDDGGVIEGRARRRAGVAVVATTGLGALGVALAAIAASGAAPMPYTVVLGGTASPVAPDTATPSPGASLVFVNAAQAPYALTRTAAPFVLATTIAPMSTSTPLLVPTAPGSYPYTAQLVPTAGFLQPAATPGPSISAQIVIASPSAAASLAPAPVPSVAGSAPAAATTSAATRASAKPRSKKPAARRSSAKASPSASMTATNVGGVLPAPAQPPLFSDGSAVPLPVLPTSTPISAPTGTLDAGQQPVAPVAPVATSAPPLPVGPFLASAPRQGPRRSRGLPLALAFVVLLGVGSGLVRTLARTRRWPGQTR